MQVHTCNQKGSQSQGDFTQRIYLDYVLYIYSSRIASRLHRASSDAFVWNYTPYWVKSVVVTSQFID